MIGCDLDRLPPQRRGNRRCSRCCCGHRFRCFFGFGFRDGCSRHIAEVKGKFILGRWCARVIIARHETHISFDRSALGSIGKLEILLEHHSALKPWQIEIQEFIEMHSFFRIGSGDACSLQAGRSLNDDGSRIGDSRFITHVGHLDTIDMPTRFDLRSNNKSTFAGSSAFCCCRPLHMRRSRKRDSAAQQE